MNIGFFGHSTASWAKSPHHESFIDQLVACFNAKLVATGVPQGSQERILWTLKKTPDLDIAIIFHSAPRYLFLPHCSRDININIVPEDKAQQFWSENIDENSEEQFEKEFLSYGGIRESFGTKEEFINCVKAYKRHLYHADLQINRYQSAVVLVDSFITNRKIKTIHVIAPEMLPAWFQFSSGVIDTEILPLTLQYKGATPNGLNIEGNAKVFARLKTLLGQLT